MGTKSLNFPWSQINDFGGKAGVGAYLTAPATTDVTTAYTTLLGTFNNVVSEMFIINLDGKLEYSPSDGISRTFQLLYSATVQAPNVGDIITIGVEIGNGSPVIVAGTEVAIFCKTANVPYNGAMVLPIAALMEPGDTIEIQIKGDSSFTATVNAFNTSLMKFY